MKRAPKLTALDLEFIRRRILNGDRIKDIAQHYKVHPGHISRIKHHRVWRGGASPAQRRRSAAEERWNIMYQRVCAIAGESAPGAIKARNMFIQLVSEGMLKLSDRANWYGHLRQSRFAALNMRREKQPSHIASI